MKIKLVLYGNTRRLQHKIQKIPVNHDFLEETMLRETKLAETTNASQISM